MNNPHRNHSDQAPRAHTVRNLDNSTARAVLEEENSYENCTECRDSFSSSGEIASNTDGDQRTVRRLKLAEAKAPRTLPAPIIGNPSSAPGGYPVDAVFTTDEVSSEVSWEVSSENRDELSDELVGIVAYIPEDPLLVHAERIEDVKPKRKSWFKRVGGSMWRRKSNVTQIEDLEHSGVANQTTLFPGTSGQESRISIPQSICLDTKRLTLQGRLGWGGFADVLAGTYSTRNGNKEAVAFKQFRIDESELNENDAISIERELDVLQSFQLHENVVTLLGACSDSGATNSYRRRVGFGIMLELADLGSLRQYLVDSKTDKSSRAVQQSILLDVARGMLALHSHRPRPIIHRDLKSMNVLLFSDPSSQGILAKISDFGLACAVTNSSAATATKGVGTTNWMAPEALEGHYSVGSDVWSFGMVMYEMATCRLPYEGTGSIQVMRKIDKGELPDLSMIPYPSQTLFQS